MRWLARFLRGATTPVALALACTLGGAIGATPWPRGAVLIGLLVLVAVTGNLNLVVTSAVAIGLRLARPALEGPASGVGRRIVDGPLSDLFAAAVNTPGLALLGLDTYGVPGGAVLGGVIGLALFAALLREVRTFRRRLARLEPGSELLRQFMARPVSRITAALVLVSGRHADWKAALRAPGVPAFAIRAAAAAALAATMLAVGSSPLGRGLAAREALSRIAPGLQARRVIWDREAGTVTFLDLAPRPRRAARPYALHAAQIRAEGVRLDPLRARVQADRVVVESCELRALAVIPSQPPPSLLPGEVSSAQIWTDPAPWVAVTSCLSDAIVIVGRTRPSTGAEPLPGRPRTPPAPSSEAEARHLLRGPAKVSIGELLAEGARLPGGITFTLRASGVSTHPWLEASPARIEATGPGFRASLSPGDDAALRLAIETDTLPIDAALAALREPPEPRPEGGTVRGRLSAPVTTGRQPSLDTAVLVTISGSALSIAGQPPRPAPEFTVRIGLNGPIAHLVVSVAPDAVMRALTDVGATDLAEALRASRRDESMKEPAPSGSPGP